MPRFFVVSAIALVCFALALPVIASTYVSFDVPNSNGTAVPEAVNKFGSVAGYYTSNTQSGAYSGFVYQSSGTITAFKVPGQWRTVPLSINGTGWIAGYYYGVDGVLHGFLRNPKYTTLDAPGAGTQSGQGTEALSMNDAGQIAGVYFDSSSVEHGFVWTSSGGFTTFDIPGGAAVTSAVLNQAGEVTGSYKASGGQLDVPSGYAMDTAGNITTFTVPNSAETFVVGINSTGQIAGYYFYGGTAQPFFRDQFGNITTFSVTGFQGVAGVEDNGNVEGLYQATNSNTRRGWQHTSGGAITFFADPSAGSDGTYPLCVSGNGKVAGYYFDSQSNYHNFLKSN
jgi:hypothetical protein